MGSKLIFLVKPRHSFLEFPKWRRLAKKNLADHWNWFVLGSLGWERTWLPFGRTSICWERTVYHSLVQATLWRFLLLRIFLITHSVSRAEALKEESVVLRKPKGPIAVIAVSWRRPRKILPPAEKSRLIEKLAGFGWRPENKKDGAFIQWTPGCRSSFRRGKYVKATPWRVLFIRLLLPGARVYSKHRQKRSDVC